MNKEYVKRTLTHKPKHKFNIDYEYCLYDKTNSVVVSSVNILDICSFLGRTKNCLQSAMSRKQKMKGQYTCERVYVGGLNEI